MRLRAFAAGALRAARWSFRSRAAMAAVAATLTLVAGRAQAQGVPGPAKPTTPPTAAGVGTPPSPAKLAAVEELLRVTDVERTITQSADMMVKAQLQQMPQLAPYEDVLRQFYGEQLNWTVMKPEFVSIYSDVFTERELRDITAFYRTPLGRTMMAKMPEVMARSAQLSQKRIQAALPQLMTRLQQRQAELKREGKTPK